MYRFARAWSSEVLPGLLRPVPPMRLRSRSICHHQRFQQSYVCMGLEQCELVMQSDGAHAYCSCAQVSAALTGRTM